MYRVLAHQIAYIEIVFAKRSQVDVVSQWPSVFCCNDGSMGFCSSPIFKSDLLFHVHSCSLNCQFYALEKNERRRKSLHATMVSIVFLIFKSVCGFTD